jgi:hypothetical protein
MTTNTKTAETLTEARALTLATTIRGITGVEWAKAYGLRVVIQLTGCGRVRRGARLSVEADGSVRLPDSSTARDAYADEISAICAAL